MNLIDCELCGQMHAEGACRSAQDPEVVVTVIFSADENWPEVARKRLRIEFPAGLGVVD